MKKSILTLIAVMPLLALGQAYNSPSTSSGLPPIVTILFGFGICLVVFLVLREVMMWYWKINKIIETQEKIIKVLEEQQAFNQERSMKLDKHHQYMENNIYSIKDHLIKGSTDTL